VTTQLKRVLAALFGAVLGALLGLLLWAVVFDPNTLRGWEARLVVTCAAVGALLGVLFPRAASFMFKVAANFKS
jgi:hypothetical protein